MPTARPLEILTPLLAAVPDLTAIEDEASWNTIRDHAARYGVAGLVAYAARPSVTGSERAWCDRVLVDNWRRHAAMLSQLAAILALLRKAEIPAIALKGPLLAQRYYTPEFLRKPSLDLDLAIPKEHVQRACDVLIAEGYTADASLDESMARSHHITLRQPARATLELHFRLSHMALGIPVEEFFDRSIPWRLPDGEEARVLGPADQLLHLVLHLAQSRFGTLFHLAEIRRVCDAEPASVRAEAIQRAVDRGFCGTLRMTDVALRTLWNTRFIPEGTNVPTTWLNWRLNEKLYRSFERWSEPGHGLTMAARIRGRLLDLQITDSAYDAVRWAGLFIKTARFQTRRGAWGTAKNLTYAPGTSAQNPRP
jgi:hypothetical protein